jgi:hypothetical protein
VSADSNGYGVFNNDEKSNWSLGVASVSKELPIDDGPGIESFSKKAALRKVVTSWEILRSGMDSSSSDW